MIRKIPAENRFEAHHDWLRTYHLFSFANYFDKGNMNFGALRVFNDDHIDGENGFGAHSHEDMEIVTIVHDGELTHQDSMGNTGKIKAGEVQYMSAGTGVTHAEINQAKERVHLYQIWIFPDKQHQSPQYAQQDFSDSPTNALIAVASGQNLPDVIPIRANTTIYTSKLEKEQTLKHTLDTDRGLFVYVKEGSININRITFQKGDQARIMDESELVIKANQDSEFVAIDTSMRLPF